MPQRGRAKKAAARQTQLGQRKKRHAKGPSDALSATASPPVARPEDGAAALPARSDAPTHQPGAAQRAPSGRHTDVRPTANSYVGPEIKRIMVLSSAILAVLVVLTFIMR